MTEDKLVEKVWRAIFESKVFSEMGTCDRDAAIAAIAAMKEAGWVPTFHKDEPGTRPGGTYMLVGDRWYFQIPIVVKPVGVASTSATP